MNTNEALFQFCLRMGDNTLVLGHRLSEWCGKGPALEEDIALANTALDLIGQTQNWLALAGEIEGKGRSADDLAMLRDAWDFRNVLLVEQPNGDFGQTLMRSLLFDSWHLAMLEALRASKEERIAAIAEKSAKEVAYHVERATDLVVRLGDGTPESHRRMQAALDVLYPYVGELFAPDAIDYHLQEIGVTPDLTVLRARFDASVTDTMAQATLTMPDTSFSHTGGKNGYRHSEHLGHLLTEMQWLQRAYPGASW